MERKPSVLCLLCGCLISFQPLLTLPPLKHPPPLAHPPPPTTVHHPFFHLLLSTVRTKPDNAIYSLVALATLPTMVSIWRLRGHRHEDQGFRTTALQDWHHYIAILTTY